MTTPVAPAFTETVQIPGGLSVNQLLEQMAIMQAQLNTLSGKVDGPASNLPREEKTYYHRTEGSTIVVCKKGPRGEQIPMTATFYGGRITTTDPDVQDFLDDIVDAPGSSVYSGKPVGADPAAVAAALVVQEIAAKSIDRMGSEAQK